MKKTEVNLQKLGFTIEDVSEIEREPMSASEMSEILLQMVHEYADYSDEEFAKHMRRNYGLSHDDSMYLRRKMIGAEVTSRFLNALYDN